MATPQRSNRGPSAGPANRQALLDAARSIFAESGFGAPLSAIAKKAGVGQGSLYRHFPDRLSIALAIFEENLSDLEALARDPSSGLTELFDAVSAQAIDSALLVDAVAAAPHDEQAVALEARMRAVAAELLARDQSRGRILRTVEPDDVTLALSMLALVLARTDPLARREAATRARAIFRGSFTGGHA